MLFSTIIRNVAHRKSTGLRFASTEEIKKYKTSSQALAQWLDVSIVSKKGRAFDADADLVVKSKSEVFPTAKVFNLDGQSISIPDDIDAKAKLVVVSFKGYGFNLLRTWIDPFIARFNTPVPTIADGGNTFAVNDIVKPLSKPNGALAFEICFVEYGFLSFAKSIFASNIRNNVDPSQVNRTGMIFGGAKDFAAPLLLPNVYTGYAFLLDSDNKIRWRGSGEAEEHEVEALLRCTEELLVETL